MNKFFLIGCFLLSMTCRADTQQGSTLQQLTGIWEGSAIQDEPRSTWSIKITITPDSYSIEYPSLNCGGILELTKENDDSLVFHEILTYGLDGCYNNGKTILIKATDSNRLRYYWFFEKGGRKAAAGMLTRQAFSEKN